MKEFPNHVKCGQCNKEVRIKTSYQKIALSAGRNVYCSKKCSNKFSNERNKTRYTGTCLTCNKFFYSRRKNKIFCSLNCYNKHPDTKKRLKDHNLKQKKAPCNCPNCDKLFHHKYRKFCCNICRREYFATRFDRWIANPEFIPLPQNYDEFLNRAELNCIIGDCNWIGVNLGHHINFHHGIPLNKFKEIAGFNKTTGLVGKEFSKYLRTKMLRLIKEGIIQPDPSTLIHNNNRDFDVRPEAIEHWKKSRILKQINS